MVDYLHCRGLLMIKKKAVTSFCNWTYFQFGSHIVWDDLKITKFIIFWAGFGGTECCYLNGKWKRKNWWIPGIKPMGNSTSCASVDNACRIGTNPHHKCDHITLLARQRFSFLDFFSFSFKCESQTSFFSLNALGGTSHRRILAESFPWALPLYQC